MTDLMTPAEFGARIRKSGDWVLRNYRNEAIPHRKIGRSIGFTEEDYAAYLEAKRVAPTPMRSKRSRSPRK